MKEHFREIDWNLNRVINKCMLIVWLVINLTLNVTYGLEVVKGTRTVPYLLVFIAITMGPYLICLFLYHKTNLEYNLSIIMVFCYFAMYTFVMVTGSTTMVFSYILPLLSFMILFHRPGLIIWTGIASLIVNIISIIMRVVDGSLTVTNSRDAEIQIALLLFCFGGAYVSSRVYDKILKRNQEYIEKTLAQARKIIQQQEKMDILTENMKSASHTARVDALTGLANRLAYDETLARLERDDEAAGIIYCDVNGLKVKNDTEGHEAGDRLLQEFGAIMTTNFRHRDCFRISGDEFVIVLSNVEKDVFEIRAERFHNLCRTMTLPIASVGWYFGNDDVQEAVRNAEAMMYKDKKGFYEEFPLYRR